MSRESFVTARVEAATNGGLGVVRLEDQVVLVHDVLPGELVRLRRNGARVLPRSAEVLEPSSDRVAPPCPIQRSCGACDLMHAAPAAQARIHAEILRGLVEHAARSANVDTPGEIVPAVHAAPQPLGYRGRARFHLSADTRGAKVGYFAAASHDLLVLSACPVLEPGLLEAARSIATALRTARRAKGELSVAFGERQGRRLPVVALTVDHDPAPELFAALDRRCTADGDLAGAHVLLQGAAKPIVFGDPRSVQRGADGVPLVLAAAGFAQPSEWAATLLATRVKELAKPEGASVLELFAGSGTLSVALAATARSFASIESADDAVACARENLAVRGLSGKLRVGDAETAELPRGLDVIMLDPPRTGAAKSAAAIAKAQPKRVVYVSCDAPTLARDLGPLLRAGYRLTALETAEIFPQTSHFETVAALALDKRRRA